MARGKVQWFDNKKGFGFITEESGPLVFVHHTQILGKGFKTLNEGEEVTFDIVDTDKGPKAENVQRQMEIAESNEKENADIPQHKPIRFQTTISPPAIVIAWDPEIVDPEDYADLVEAIGNLVRSNGGSGVKLLQSNGFGISVEEVVVV